MWDACLIWLFFFFFWPRDGLMVWSHYGGNNEKRGEGGRGTERETRRREEARGKSRWRSKRVARVSVFKGDVTLIFRLILLFWVTTRIGLHALVVQKHISFLTHCRIPPNPVHLNHCSDWSAHTRLSQRCSLCLLSTLFCFQLSASLTSIMIIGVN